MKNELMPTLGFVELYDNMILAPEMRGMYGDAGFYNVGEWSKNPETLGAACYALTIKHIDQVAVDLNPVNILDAGCGLGSGSAVIAQHFSNANITAINISEKQVSFAKERNPGIEFLVMDATKMDFPADRFDLIICIEAAFHFDTRQDFLKQAIRILRPEGQLIYTDILFNNTQWVGEWSVPEANLVTDINEYKTLCTDAGFQLQQCDDITATTIKGFCNYLRNVAAMPALADGFENSIIAYLLVSLKK